MAGLQVWNVEKPWLETHCSLGEGPFYEKETESIRFVDIVKKHIHTVSLSEGLPSLKTIELDVCPTVTADIEGLDPRDKILVGLKHGAAVLDRKTGKYELIQPFNEPHNERLRSNDGAVDPNSRFWLGTMSDVGLDLRPEGSLFRLDAKSREEFLNHLTIPNSIGWSPDSKTMYFTHSTAQTLFAYDYDVATGAVATDTRRVFFKLPTSGDPDGFRVDVDGNVWSAVYGESRVIKISPKGELIGEVRLPTRNITCVQFVGTELVITSAADKDGEGPSKEFGGAVFRVDVGARGLDPFKFKL